MTNSKAGAKKGVKHSYPATRKKPKKAKPKSVKETALELRGGVKLATTKITPHPRVGDDVEKFGPRIPGFEKKIEDLGGGPEPPKQKSPEIAKEVQADLDSKVIADFLKLPFATWASRINFPAIRLTDKEALEWAEPTKVLLDHYMPVIPPIAYAWFAWSVTTISIVNARIELIAAEKRKRGESQTETKAGPVEAPVQGAPAIKPRKI